MKITKNRITWDAADFLSGLHPQYTSALTDIPMPQVFDQLTFASNMNPYRYLGYAYPGFLATDVTNVTQTNSAAPLAGTGGTESGTNYGYIITNSNQVLRLDISTNTLSTTGGWPYTIAATAAEEGSDIITYKTNIGSTKTNVVFFSYNDNGADLWNVGIYNLSAGTFDPDWMSTVPATPLAAPEISSDDLPHPMLVASDDTLLIASGNAVHGLDGSTGANGTFEKNRLVLPAGYIITSMSPLPEGVAIFAYYSPSGNAVVPNFISSGPAKCFVWDLLSLDPTYIYDLNDFVVTSSFVLNNGNIGCFTQGIEPMPDGTNRFSKLQLYNGSGFDNIVSFIGNAPGHGGVVVNGQAIYWNTDGVVHSYGAPFPNLPEGLNKLQAGSGTSARLMLKQYTSNKLLISSGSGTSGGLQRFVTTQFSANASFSTSVAQPPFPYGQMGKVKGVIISFADTAADGRNLTLYLQDTINGTTQVIDIIEDVVAADIVKKYEYSISGGELKRFDALRCLGVWAAGTAATDAPGIRQVDVEFETTNIKQG